MEKQFRVTVLCNGNGDVYSMTNDRINLDLEKDKVVIFADILGFSKKIKDIATYQDDIKSSLSNNERTDGCICQLSNIYKALTQMDNSKEIQNYRNYKFWWISDSILLTSNYDKIGFILDIIANFSRLMLTFGMLIRGGISCGDIHDSDNIVGVPYIEAVELEKKANYPRIIIQKDKYSKIKQYLCNEYEFMRDYFKLTETDDFFEFDFIEYNICGGVSKNFSAITLEEYVSIFKNEMDSRIKTNEKDIKIIEKYAWLGKKLISITEKHREDYDTNTNELCLFKNSQQILDTIMQYKAIDLL